jgi:NAD(P)H-hydrate epimerase
MRAVDAEASRAFAVPAAVLMENAGRGVAERLERLAAAGTIRRRALVVAGPGNNGGDGLVVARTLRALGWWAQAWYVGDPARRERLSPEATLQLVMAERSGHQPLAVRDGAERAALERALADTCAAGGVVVDALFGTGLARRVEGVSAEVLVAIAASRAPVLAVDVPSGLDADSGLELGPVCTARWTSTLAALKPGLFTERGRALAGELELVEIGLPAALLAGLPRHAG